MNEASRNKKNEDEIKFIGGWLQKSNCWGDENQKQFQLYEREGIDHIFSLHFSFWGEIIGQLVKTSIIFPNINRTERK